MPRTTGTAAKQRVASPLNKLLKVIRSELIKEVQPVPDGWYTVKQLANQLGLSDCHTRHKIAALFGRGKLEQQMFWVMTSNNCRKRVPHYKLSQLS